MDNDNYLTELAMTSLLFFDHLINFFDKFIFNLILFELSFLAARFLFRFIEIGKFLTSLAQTRSSVFLLEEM